MFKLGTEVSSSLLRERKRERNRDRTDAVLRLIHPRFIKLNQRELVKALFSYVRSSTMHHRRGKFQFRGRYFRNSLFRVPTNLHPPPPPYSTDQRRSFDSKILDREFTPSTNWIFSERDDAFVFTFVSPPEGIQSLEEEERWNVTFVGSKVKGETATVWGGGDSMKRR